MKKKNILLILLISFVLIISGIVWQLLAPKSTDKGDNNNDSENIKNSTVVYECRDNDNVKTNYTVYNSIRVLFENGKIVNGNQSQTYKFKDSSIYNDFNIDKSEYFNPSSIDRDDTNMTITYTFSHYFPQKENESIDAYIKNIESKGYQCSKK